MKHKTIVGLLTIVVLSGSGWGLYQAVVVPRLRDQGLPVALLRARLQSLPLTSPSPLLQLQNELVELSAYGAITKAQVYSNLLAALLDRDFTTRMYAAQLLGEFGDASVVPYLIEVLHFELFVTGGERDAVALERLTGQSYGSDWRAWYEWWWRDHPVPSGFERWKLKLFTTFVPSIADLLKPDRLRTISLLDVQWGGVGKGEIPALNDPAMYQTEEADEILRDEEMVFGVVLNGDARAYPLRYMDRHELVNGTVGGRPIMISFCTLCGSAVLYDRELGGTVYTFGTSGLLYKSNKLMYDEETNSLWPNLEGRPVIGPLAQSKLELRRYPLTQTTWGDWKAKHAETTVLLIKLPQAQPGKRKIISDGSQSDYEPGSAYREYRDSPDPLYPVLERDARLPSKAWVFGLDLDGQAKAYAMQLLNERPVLNDRVGKTSLVILTERQPGALNLWHSGGPVRVYERKGHVFKQTASGELQDERDQIWMVSEEALVNTMTGERLQRRTGQKAYWFAWFEFHSQTQLYRATSEH